MCFYFCSLDFDIAESYVLKKVSLNNLFRCFFLDSCGIVSNLHTGGKDALQQHILSLSQGRVRLGRAPF